MKTERISITQAAHQLPELLNRVIRQGASFELEQDNRVVARLLPVGLPAPVYVKDLNRLFAELPSLGEDAATFVEDLDTIHRALPPEQDSWV